VSWFLWLVIAFGCLATFIAAIAGKNRGGRR